MRLDDFGSDLDKRLMAVSALAARRLSRRLLLGRILRGSAVAFAGLAAGSLGTLLNGGDGEATTFHCGNWWPNSRSGSPQCNGCPSNGCSFGHVRCRKGQCPGCIYPSGYWVAANGLGKCGMGYRLCWDCHSPSSCRICTCLSTTLCLNCCSAAEVEAQTREVEAIP
jgi:hypothetical protein